jgi:hypothetical protein
MAQMRSADRIQKCLLFGVDRTYRRHHETDAFDPTQTSRTAYSITSPVRGGKNGWMAYTGADIIREAPQAAIHGKGIRRHLVS